MKKTLLIVFALVFAVASNVFATDAISIIMNRKSVRNYERGKISDKDLDTIIKAGFAAPSARDIRPWSFVVVDDFSVLDSLSKTFSHLKTAGAAIIICGKTDENLFWITDCSAAAENILLAVESLGLGAVWMAAFPSEERIKAVRTILNVPNEYTPLCVIPIGKSKGINKPKNKYDDKKLHRNRW
ncbi:MAG: nitroreductase family protein [Elusimicrobiota bacterium]|jgi:nitroreductase|nr:nitroreductase family protein [Elusimicrobiota bacterium]